MYGPIFRCFHCRVIGYIFSINQRCNVIGLIVNFTTNQIYKRRLAFCRAYIQNRTGSWVLTSLYITTSIVHCIKQLRPTPPRVGGQLLSKFKDVQARLSTNRADIIVIKLTDALLEIVRCNAVRNKTYLNSVLKLNDECIPNYTSLFLSMNNLNQDNFLQCNTFFLPFSRVCNNPRKVTHKGA